MNNNTSHANEPPRLLTVPQFVERHAWATTGGIRHLIFHAKHNGFHRCIRRLGRRVLLDEDIVFAWLEEQNGGEINA